MESPADTSPFDRSTIETIGIAVHLVAEANAALERLPKAQQHQLSVLCALPGLLRACLVAAQPFAPAKRRGRPLRVQGATEMHVFAMPTEDGESASGPRDAIVGQTSNQPHVKLLRLPAVLERVGLRRTAIYALMKDKEFPSAIKIGSTSAWDDEEITGWIESRKSARPDADLWNKRQMRYSAAKSQAAKACLDESARDAAIVVADRLLDAAETIGALHPRQQEYLTAASGGTIPGHLVATLESIKTVSSQAALHIQNHGRLKWRIPSTAL